MKTSSLIASCMIAATLLVGCTTTTSNSSTDSSINSGPPVDKKIVAANANIQLGMDYLQKGNVNTAKQKLLLALDLAPKYAPAWYTMAYFYEATGDHQKANDYYSKAIDLAPNSGDAQNNYGTFLCQTGKPKESISYFLAATKDPNYINTAAAFENAGLCALKIPDLRQATAYFLKAIAQDPQRKESVLALAAIDYHQANYTATYARINQLLALGHPDAGTLLLASRTANKLGQKQKAQQYAAQLKAQFPKSSEAKKI